MLSGASSQEHRRNPEHLLLEPALVAFVRELPVPLRLSICFTTDNVLLVYDVARQQVWHRMPSRLTVTT